MTRTTGFCSVVEFDVAVDVDADIDIFVHAAISPNHSLYLVLVEGKCEERV